MVIIMDKFVFEVWQNLDKKFSAQKKGSGVVVSVRIKNYSPSQLSGLKADMELRNMSAVMFNLERNGKVVLHDFPEFFIKEFGAKDAIIFARV
jgi:hypothetical protein